MQISGNTVFITGGATGIGLALAEAFLAQKNEVIICGRRADALAQAQAKHPKLYVFQADLTDPAARKSLVERLVADFPSLNILVNNAGIQRKFLADSPDAAAAFEAENEIEINLTAPIHLAFLLLSQLKKQKNAAIVNVSSGLGYVPMAAMPVYSATKSALISFSRSLRSQLGGSGVRVFDLAPPIVTTDLDKGARARRGQTDLGIAPVAVADAAIEGMAADQFDIAVGKVKFLKIIARLTPSGAFGIINKAVKN